MTYAANAADAAQEHVEMVQLLLPAITGTCTVGGAQGWNTPTTCDQTWNGTTYRSYFFATQNKPAALGTRGTFQADGQPVHPCIVSIDEQVSELPRSPGVALRASVTVRLRDFEGDPGPVRTSSSGTYFGKLRGRNALVGQRARVWWTHALDSYAGDDLLRRDFEIRELRNLNDGMWELVMTDPLARLGSKESVFPGRPSTNLLYDLDDTETVFVIGDHPHFQGLTDAIVRVEDELMRITASRAAPGGRGIEITVQGRGGNILVRGQVLANSIAAPHEAGTSVARGQRVLRQPVDVIMRLILENCGIDVSGAASAQFAQEALYQHRDRTPSRVYYEDFSCLEALEELCRDYRMYIWHDPFENEIVLGGDRRWNASLNPRPTINEANGRIVYGTLRTTDLEEERCTRALVYFNPVSSVVRDDIQDFRSRAEYDDAVDTPAAERLPAGGGQEPKTIRFPNTKTLGSVPANQLVRDTVLTRRDMPRELKWTTDERWASEQRVGRVVTVETPEVQDVDGTPRTLTAMILAQRPVYAPEGRRFEITAFAIEEPSSPLDYLAVDVSIPDLDIYEYLREPAADSQGRIVVVVDGATLVHPSAGAVPSSETLVLCLVNQALITGHGGDGGRGADQLIVRRRSPGYVVPGFAGGPGGDGLMAGSTTVQLYVEGSIPAAFNLPDTLSLDGYVWAPGGGGDGGRSSGKSKDSVGKPQEVRLQAGGGGGGGAPNGDGGRGGEVSWNMEERWTSIGEPGAPGRNDGGGPGGDPGPALDSEYYPVGRGGDGGDYGEYGRTESFTGQTSMAAGGPPGTAWVGAGVSLVPPNPSSGRFIRGRTVVATGQPGAPGALEGVAVIANYFYQELPPIPGATFVSGMLPAGIAVETVNIPLPFGGGILIQAFLAGFAEGPVGIHNLVWQGSVGTGVNVQITVVAGGVPQFPAEIYRFSGFAGTAFSETLVEAVNGLPPIVYSMTPDPGRGLVFDPAARTLTGTPTAVGQSTHIYAGTDSDDDIAEATVLIDIAAGTGQGNGIIVFNQLVQGAVGDAISVLLTPATGGVGPYTYTLGAIPGLTFQGDPTMPNFLQLSGTLAATSQGQYTFTATDANMQSNTAAVTVELRPGLSLSGTQISGMPGASITVVLDPATGGRRPYTYSLAAIPGFTFSTITRTLTGVLATASAGNYAYNVSDANGVTASATVSVNVMQPPPMTLVLAGAEVTGFAGDTVNRTLPAAVGGSTPYTYTLDAISGLTFTAATRNLAGTLAAASAGDYDYTVTDDDGTTRTATVTVTILTSTFALQGATISGFSQDAVDMLLPAASGNFAPPIVYSLDPIPGLTFSPGTRRLMGTLFPNSAGLYDYVATDDDGTQVTNVVTVTILTAPLFLPGDFIIGAAGTAVSRQLPPATGGMSPWTYTLGPLPATLTFNAGPRLVAGTIPLVSSTLNYGVTDGAGNTASAAVQIVVI